MYKTAAGVAAAGLALGLACTAQADVVLPVQNLAFNTFTGTFTGPKDFFTHAQPTDWSIGSTAELDNLIYVGQQGSEGFPTSRAAIFMVSMGPTKTPFPPAPTSIRRTATRNTRARSCRPLPV